MASQRLETACELALQQVPSPRYKLIQNILVTQQDIKIEKPASRSRILLSEEQLITEVNIMVNETIRKLQEMRLSVMAKTYTD